MAAHPMIALIFRRPGHSGYFSIERSFEAVWPYLNAAKNCSIHRVIACQISKGMRPRLAIFFQMKRLRAQVYHISGDIHFAALATPKRRTILTIHDCGFLQHPNPIARLLLAWFWLKWPVRRSRIITAVSEATKNAIVQHAGCSPDKIKVIPTAIPEHFQAMPQPFNSEKPRILHIGAAPNKNLLRHIESVKNIPCVLHIVAPLRHEEKQLLEAYGIEYECTPELGYEALVQAYENCDLLLFASTLEGFGMPILEAQSIGRSVVTGNCSSMPEVAGDGACLVNPFDSNSIREGLLRVIQDAAYRQKLIHDGFENVRRFHAKTIAEQYNQLYQTILEEV